MEKQHLAGASLRRMVRSNDGAAMVLFLLSPMGDNLPGQSLGIDGNVETLWEYERWQLSPLSVPD